MICSTSDNMLYVLRHLAVRFGRKSELSSPFYTLKNILNIVSSGNLQCVSSTTHKIVSTPIHMIKKPNMYLPLQCRATHKVDLGLSI